MIWYDCKAYLCLHSMSDDGDDNNKTSRTYVYNHKNI